MNAANDHQFETSRKDLAAGILKQAALDLRQFHGATSGLEREFYLDAYRWVTSDDCSWPFAFLNVCQALNLAPETVREEVLGDLSLGAFGYLSRRCARATRRFKTFLSRLGVETDRASRVRVQKDLRVPGHPEIFVIGDTASLDQDGKPLPGVAQVAMQQGRYVGKFISSTCHKIA